MKYVETEFSYKKNWMKWPNLELYLDYIINLTQAWCIRTNNLF